MANSSDSQISFIYNGATYTKDIGAVNQGRVEALKAEYLKQYGDAAKDNPNLEAVALSRAKNQEHAERVKKAMDEFHQDNSNILDHDGSPHFTKPNGGMETGDPGISQRRTKTAEEPKGVKKVAGTDHADQTVMTDAEGKKAVATLADDINKMLDDTDGSLYKKGWVNRKFEILNKSETFWAQAIDLAMQSKGAGNPQTQIAQFFSRFDRFGNSMVPQNSEFDGYTFITRPRCNLSLTNVVADDKFSAMRSNDPREYPYVYAIRCLLDTRFAARDQNSHGCPFFDPSAGYNTLLFNSIKSISGFVDPVLEVETSQGGFFSEDQTYVIGSDRLAKTYDLQLQFRDIQGGPVAALFDYWCQYMGNLQDGTMVQYGDDIDANRIAYTVSIYRFLTDRSRRHISKWAKCTGCFPVTAPCGVPFNKNQGESLIEAAKEFSITFKCNRIEYNKPVIISEFNTITRRYAGWDSAAGPKGVGSHPAFAPRAQNNFSGLPYIRIGERGYEMVMLKHDSAHKEISLTAGSSGSSISGLNTL